MPYYPWQCQKTGLEIEVLRSFDDYQNPPTDDELPEDERGKERDWKRLIGGGIKTTFAQYSLKGNMGRG